MKRSIEELLLSGGDERLNLKENGLNKYFIQPHSYIKTLLRGSCTCNPLNSFSEQHLTNKFSESNLDFIKVREDQRNRISKLYNYKNQVF